MATETEDVWVCGKCGGEISETDKFCKKCGEPIDSETEDVWVCGKCGGEISETDKFCKKCGEPIDSETEDVWVCGECEGEISETDKFCKNCGEQIDSEIILDIENKETKKKSKDILLIILVAISIVYIYFVLNDILIINHQEKTPLDIPERMPIYEPQSIQTPASYGKLLIDAISSDLDNFHDNGWQDLYERNEFDCSRMTTYMWDYIRTKYKIPPKIVISDEREHAWLALRVSDVGETDRYEQWTIKGVDYYFLESTYPNIVKKISNYQMGNIIYQSSIDFYTTRIYIADDPLEANDISGRWSLEFRLIKSDLDKLNTFKEG